MKEKKKRRRGNGQELEVASELYVRRRKQE